MKIILYDFALLVFCLAALCSSPALGYSVLTHEAIIDAAWDGHLKPTLLRRFPDATEEDLLDAHAYAYGGCLIQDMGYYPFGSKFFTDLTHYIRSGDFILSLIRGSRDLNEYAFALGAMQHYASDNCGHSIGVNPAVSSIYPDDVADHDGDSSYDACPKGHLRVEFGFDVMQVARGKYTSKAYHDFIGFKVAPRLLNASFRETYGLELEELFDDLDLAMGSYRYAVSQLIPHATEVAWELKKDQLLKATPDLRREQFLYTLTPAEYQRDWGNHYRRPGPVSKFLALLVRIIPRVGPAAALGFKALPPEVEQKMVESFDASLAQYQQLLEQTCRGEPVLPNTNFDLGCPSRAGDYRGADRTYLRLMKMLRKRQFQGVTPELREALLAYGEGKDAVARLRLTWWDRQKFSRTLAFLRASSPQSVATPIPVATPAPSARGF